jgi:hypothetical protein
LSGKQARRDKRILALGIALPSEMNLTSPLIGGVAIYFGKSLEKMSAIGLLAWRMPY